MSRAMSWVGCDPIAWSRLSEASAEQQMEESFMHPTPAAMVENAAEMLHGLDPHSLHDRSCWKNKYSRKVNS